MRRRAPTLSRCACAAVAIFAVSLVSGCSVLEQKPRPPLQMDATLKPDDIDEVVVLPVIDARPARLEQVQIARNVEDATVRRLRERGYFTLTADNFRQKPAGPLDLHVAGPDQLVPLAPEDSKYFMLIQVERLEPGTDPENMTYDAKVGGVLVDRSQGRVVWRDFATASSSLSGVLTVFSRGSRQYEAAVNASRALVDSLPDKNPAHVHR